MLDVESVVSTHINQLLGNLNILKISLKTFKLFHFNKEIKLSNNIDASIATH